jgi:hypothetical protein
MSHRPPIRGGKGASMHGSVSDPGKGYRPGHINDFHTFGLLLDGGQSFPPNVMV